MILSIVYFSYEDLDVSSNSLKNLAYLIGVKEFNINSFDEATLNKLINKLDRITEQKKEVDLWGWQQGKEINLELEDVELIINSIDYNIKNMNQEQLKGYLHSDIEKIYKVRDHLASFLENRE